MARKSYLGVDLGTSGIKITQLENYRGQPKLVTYGYAEAKFDLIRDQSKGLQTTVADLMSKVLARAHVTTRQAVAALPTFAVFNSIISLPRMSRRDLNTAVKWEAKKFIPLPIEEMILSHQILDGGDTTLAEKIFMMNVGSLFGKKKEEKPGAPSPGATEAKTAPPPGGQAQPLPPDAATDQKSKNVRILLTAAPKNLVSRYIEIFKLANLSLLSLETEALALSRSLVGVDMENVMVVDIGSSATNICLIEKGIPVLNRGLDIGGYNITKSISNSLNVSFERAEQFKLDFGIRMQEQRGGIPDAIKDSLQPIINEIQYVFELYQNQGSLQVDRILLSGGSAFLPNLTTYLTQLLRIPVYVGNPWDRVVYPLDLKPVLENIGPQMAVSIGLAMRNIS
ncbi:MAG: pilus assembly protein PilM [Candidatus Komeilibacteria bacterium]|nr:pilus assembly protein PilM [Candidatus Komeilibacteria bacterium]